MGQVYKGALKQSSGGGTGTDSDAVHVNVASEISGVTAKATPTTNDLLLIEDVADSNNKKKITIGDIPGTPDADAVHVNISNEITGVTEKTTVDNQDEFIIEDSEASFVKKSIKRKTIVQPIVETTSSTATLTIDSDNVDISILTAQNGSCSIASPTGTPVEGQKLIIRINDNGSGAPLSWDAIFREIDTTLPSTTTANKTIYVGCIYNTNATKWDVVAVKEES